MMKITKSEMKIKKMTMYKNYYKKKKQMMKMMMMTKENKNNKNIKKKKKKTSLNSTFSLNHPEFYYPT